MAIGHLKRSTAVCGAALALILGLGGCASMTPSVDAGTSGIAALQSERPSDALPAETLPAETLNASAEDYVRLILGIGEREPGYVDAYYGPEDWQAQAKSEALTLDQLSLRASGLATQLDALTPAATGPDEAQRVRFLKAHVSAAQARLRMLGGETLSFADEAEALFGVRPELKPLSDYDAILARLEAEVPGTGSLASRIESFKTGFIIPTDRLEPVMQAAIAECRARTVAHIALPANERFTLAFVTDKPWSGYNYFQGGAASKIEINTDFPIYTERAIDLGCHEGYPGHHVYNALLEQTFVRDRGWVEMSVYPLFSPMSFVAEGSANYGIDLAFPGNQGVVFERDVLMPLAGLAPADGATKADVQALMQQLARAEYTLADDYLSGRIGREVTIARLSKYLLSTPEKSAQRLRFIDTYRSYIINYGLGRDTVQAWVEAQGPDHWAAMQTLLSSQILPVDLLP